MEYNTVTFRSTLYDRFKNDQNHLQKGRLLGEGYQGVVHSYCDNDNLCVAVKKMYLETRQAKFLKTPYSLPALKYENFIELAAMKLINQVVLQKVCPHFVLNYRSSYKSRSKSKPCDEEYPYSSKFYNEYINDSETFTEWVKRDHSIIEWYNAYFQIIVALFCLQSYFNMTHFDLHSDNILVKRIQSGGYWEYIIDDKKYYVPNYGWVFYLNDFGHAWIPEHFQSWIVRQKYRNKKIDSNFDIKRLFESTLDFTTSPLTFKNVIRNIINKLRQTDDFVEIIPDVWDQYLIKNTDTMPIESYNLDMDIDTQEIPDELKHLIILWE
jgi:hypothetical protein